MADPISALGIASAIASLAPALKQVATLLSDFAKAEQTVADIKHDCDFTHSILEDIQEQLKSTVLPTLRIDSVDGNDSSPNSPGINTAILLQDSVSQLQLEISALLVELEGLQSLHGSKSKLGRLAANGQVVWKKSYLDTMHQKILSKIHMLQLVQSNLQSQSNSISLRRLQSQDNVGSILGEMFNLFHLKYSRDRHRRPSSTSGSSHSLPNYNAREMLVKAVRENEKREVEDLLSLNDPNFYLQEKNQLFPLHIAAQRGNLSMIELLLSHGAKVDCYTRDRKTPLMLALLKNHPVTALALIRHGANIARADDKGRTALHIAVKKNLLAVTKVLLTNGADPNAYDDSGNTPVMEAVYREDLEHQPSNTHVLRVLLDPTRPGIPADPTLGRTKDDYTPLHHAAEEGLLEELKVFQESAKLKGLRGWWSEWDSLKRQPLWFAAKRGHIKAVKLLIEYNADVNHRSKDPSYTTALWAMASSGSPDALLMKNGADPNKCDSKGNIPLHMACAKGDLRLGELLMENGADPCIPDNDGMQPIHHAAIWGHQTSIAHLLGHPGHKVDINCPDNGGMTPLIRAAEYGHEFLVNFLVKHKPHGADWKLKNHFGSDAFYIACARGHILCATYLLACGVDINMPSHNGNTPLHAAARMGHLETVRWLLRNGANREARLIVPSTGMDTGKTPAEVARASTKLENEKQREEIAAYIEGWTPAKGRAICWGVSETPEAG
ncbi:ankyrin repeat-containing domain protein [Bombardia bombarda]|uniref:Ankyrin repeat-containing domain protein n=1 Tax=Bombardia bombarda TaxID=252184 RepID=A0AA39X0B2_9PEZI|nr:ankyrin repeat-containing domain protein [Bombardia bombarda]